VAAGSHGRDEIDSAHDIDERLQESWIESSGDDRAAFFNAAPGVVFQDSLVSIIHLHHLDGVLVQGRDPSPVLGEEMTFALDLQNIPGRGYILLGTACHLADACRPGVNPRGPCQPGKLGEHQH